jgi:UDP-N-acetylmuramate--alanine ligase
MILNNKKKVHFIGIGGAGMSGLADILIDMGYQVSGSDRESSESTNYLKTRGAVIYQGHKADNISGAEMIVFSSAVPQDNPELIRARELHITCIKRAMLLGELMNRKDGIAVAGTHGKTTTTSMIGHMLKYCGLDPTVVVGGKMQNSKTNAQLGKGKFFVTEADEYDRSFLTLFPKLSVINNLEEDHLDIYENLADLKNTFLKFANQTKENGKIIINADSKNLLEIMQLNSARDVLNFAIETEADIMAENIRFKDGKTIFDVIVNKKNNGELYLNLPGKHNIYNALAAYAVGYSINLTFEQMQNALAEFKGVHRRFELKGNINGVLFFDDYAHHPTEVREALKAAKSGWKKRVIVVFQPHLFSRTRDFYKDFAMALENADKVILTPIYPAREQTVPGITSDLIAREMSENCISLQNNEMIVDAILRTIQAGDLLITMGAGDIWKYGEKALKKLELN